MVLLLKGFEMENDSTIQIGEGSVERRAYMSVGLLKV